MKQHLHPQFKNKEFISTVDGQKSLFYGDQYFEKPINNTDLRNDEKGTDPVLTECGKPAGALIAVPTGRILVYDTEKATVNRNLILSESKRVKKSNRT